MSIPGPLWAADQFCPCFGGNLRYVPRLKRCVKCASAVLCIIGEVGCSDTFLGTPALFYV